jgi:hypothetical protein
MNQILQICSEQKGGISFVHSKMASAPHAINASRRKQKVCQNSRQAGQTCFWQNITETPFQPKNKTF